MARFTTLVLATISLVLRTGSAQSSSLPLATGTASKICSHTISSYCSLAQSAGEGCLSSYPFRSESNKFLSCACETQALYAASVCEYNGNVTCFGQPAALTDIQYWQPCSAEYVSSFMAAQSTMTGVGHGVPAYPTTGEASGQASSTSQPQSTGSSASPSSTGVGKNSAKTVEIFSWRLWVCSGFVLLVGLTVV